MLLIINIEILYDQVHMKTFNKLSNIILYFILLTDFIIVIILYCQRFQFNLFIITYFRKEIGN